MPFPRKAYNSKTVKDGLRRKLTNAMNAATEAASEEMRQIISTDRLTKASNDRGGGRVESGDMLNSVQSSKVKITASGKSYQSSFGWSTTDRRAHAERIEGGRHETEGKEVKSYYDLQDWGFQAQPGVMVAGMHATEAGWHKYREVMEEQWRN